jgi:putative restriction endonuclease
MLDFSRIEIGKKYERPWLANEWGYRSYRAFAKGVFCPRDANQIILFVTRIKQESLEQYNDYISGEYLFWEGEKRHGHDKRIADSTISGDTVHLFYREIHHSPFEYRGLIALVKTASIPRKPMQFVFRLAHDLSAQDDILMHERELSSLPDTERQAVIKARVGQGTFRQRLLELWDGCAVTDVKLPNVLRASHIKPWRFSSNSERLDPYNGLLLLPQYDQLFDKGLISFDTSGEILRSPAIEKIEPAKLGIDVDDRLRALSNRHLGFLEYHRAEVFVRFSES